jgi:hypothetical protein
MLVVLSLELVRESLAKFSASCAMVSSEYVAHQDKNHIPTPVDHKQKPIGISFTTGWPFST